MNRFACQIGLAIASCLFVLVFPLYSIFWVYPQYTAIITFEKEVSAKQIANHISKMVVGDSGNQALSKEDLTDAFIGVLHEAQLDFDLAKIKVFSPGGEVLYSTDAKDIGIVNTNAYFSEVIARGKSFSKVVHKHEQNMEGQPVEKDVVETYVPLMRGKNFLGAFEIYYDITYSGFNIRNFAAKSRIIVIGAALFLLACILFISYSAITLLRKQQRAEEELQRLKERIPALYNLSSDDKER